MCIFKHILILRMEFLTSSILKDAIHWKNYLIYNYWIFVRSIYRFEALLSFQVFIRVFIQVYLEVSSIPTYIFNYIWITFLQLCLSPLEATRAVFRSRYLLPFKISKLISIPGLLQQRELTTFIRELTTRSIIKTWRFSH